jgi:hypothetical protein
LTVIIATLCLAASGNAFADTVLSIPELHDFNEGPSVIRKSFEEAWEGRSKFLFQSALCTASLSLTENDGQKDERPIKVERIRLLGAKEQEPENPAYLVQGTRWIWNGRSGADPKFVPLPCTWLVAFFGNTIRSVREANEISYLLGSEL